MVGMNVVGGKRTRSNESLTNRGCIFGSMAGMPATVATPANLNGVYQRQTSYCNYCIPPGCKAGFAYLRDKGLITYNKGAGGIGRMHYSPGIFRLYGNGYQRTI